jgi:hypothetical protein
MIIRHHLATKRNDVALKNVTFHTEHQQKGKEITHVGWKMVGEYDGPDPRQQKHRYEILFTEEEARQHLARLQTMLVNFDKEKIRELAEHHAAKAD